MQAATCANANLSSTSVVFPCPFRRQLRLRVGRSAVAGRHLGQGARAGRRLRAGLQRHPVRYRCVVVHVRGNRFSTSDYFHSCLSHDGSLGLQNQWSGPK